MHKAIHFTAVLSFIFFTVAASQNLSGTWEGHTSDGAEYWRIGIVHIGDSCYGYSYDAGPGYCNQNFAAVYNKEENKFKGQGINFISKSFDHTLIATTLRYEKRNKDEYLVGNVRAKSILIQVFSFGIGASGVLKKVSDDVDSTAYIKSVVRRLANDNYLKTIAGETPTTDTAMRLDKMNTGDSIAAKSTFEDSVALIKNSRNTSVIKTISTPTDSVTIVLYDDGEIDGDIVTIFDNGRIIVNQLALTKKPYSITIALSNNNSKHIIELMAENEGSIPPNTAYMLVLAGSERVEVKASSDKLSNAAIVIQKEE